MDIKSNPSISTINLIEEKPDSNVYYIAVKGCLHAFECSIFGLKDEEVKALEAKFKKSAHGDTYKTNVVDAANALVQLGYRIISSTVFKTAHNMEQKTCDSCNVTNPNASVCQTLSEMDWERGLWGAAYNGNIKKVQALIDKARNAKELVTTPDQGGYTALHYAARCGNLEICKILLDYGADVNAVTKHNKATPLMKAAIAGEIPTVRLLIKYGASVDTQDCDGETALHKVARNKNMDMINVLLESCPGLKDIADQKGTLPSFQLK